MKKTAFCLLFPLLLAVLAGCRTFESRSREKAAVYAALDPQTQNRLKAGIIFVGDTTDMVYLALDKPDEKHELQTGGGHTQMWVYNTYYMRYEGTATVGYRSDVIFDPASKTYHVYHEPVTRDVYSHHEEERIRVTFKDGKVSVIEQKKN